MKSFIETLKALAQAVTLGVGALAILCFVFFPGFFAERLGLTLQALDREEVTAKIKLPLLEAELRRVKDELTESDTRATAMLESMENGPPVDAIIVPPDDGTVIDPPGTDEPIVEVPIVEPLEPLFGGDWVVIAGAEKNLTSQRVELAKLRSAGFDAVILQSGEWFQSTVPFATKLEAEANLGAITSVVGETRQPYIRSLAVWCRTRTEVSGEPDVYRCG
ncbi:MAG: hypothetical protein NXH97_16515 [Rhodobacteraceae bacterium]|nr:hypothetical protein [Paracoccaceae bacterium]